MEFKLFQKLGSLEGVELVMLLITASVFLLLLVLSIIYAGKQKSEMERRPVKKVQGLVYAALCITLSFVLSYFKLFSLPFGGSVTLVSMLPIMLFANVAGPMFGFFAALSYAILQIVQGAWIVHPVQFVLDYFVAFLCLGIPSLFPGKLSLGVAIGGFCRMIASTVSGAIFFGDSGFSYGITNPWVYSLLYNFFSIGIDTLLCVVVSVIPGIRKLKEKIRVY